MKTGTISGSRDHVVLPGKAITEHLHTSLQTISHTVNLIAPFAVRLLAKPHMSAGGVRLVRVW